MVAACASSAAGSASVAAVLEAESDAGLQCLAVYEAFQQRADEVKNGLLSFLIEQKRAGKKVAAYGAAAKGNTLLNYAGVKPDLLSFVCDAAPSKQGKYLPGSHIPVFAPEKLKSEKPDFVLILPWNIAAEVMLNTNYIRQWGGQYATAVPTLEVK